jgi:hypothetical protein
MKHPVYGAIDLNPLAYIVLHELKPRPIHQMADIFPMSCNEIIDGNDLMAALHEPVADV